MVGVSFLQFFKHPVNGVFVFLVILAHFHGVDELKQGGEVLLLRWRFIVNVADQRRVQQRLSLRPELIAGFAVSLGIGDKGRDQLQDILFAVNIGEGVIVHGFLEVDRVEDFDTVVVALKQLADLADHAAFRIGDDIRGMELHEIGLQKEPRFTGAGAADDKHILVSGVLRVLWSI